MSSKLSTRLRAVSTYKAERGEPAHTTLRRAAEQGRHFRIMLPCGRVTKPIAPDIALRLAKIAEISRLD